MDILGDVRHRQWPLPSDPWVLRQAWNDLLFAHWPIARDRLASLIPNFLEIDTFDNEAWVSITPFSLSDVSPRGIPALPMISSFDEINVRTYVVHDGIPGVYFFSLDANSAAAVAAASTVFHLPYFLASIDAGVRRKADRALTFRSRRRDGRAECAVRYASAGAVFEPKPGTLDYFLTERYCLYTGNGSGRAYRVEIHHVPWELQPAEAEFAVNAMVEPVGLRLPSRPPVLHYARRQEVVTWFPHVID
jgi:uncharacterized protein YqjF (DUF2071 family)